MNENEFLKSLKKKGWPEYVVRVFMRDRLACQYCGIDGLENKNNYAQLTIDHLIPHKHDGKDDAENLVAACARCNTLKGCQLPPELTKDKIKTLSRDEKLSMIKEWMKSRMKQDEENYKDWQKFFQSR